MNGHTRTHIVSFKPLTENFEFSWGRFNIIDVAKKLSSAGVENFAMDFFRADPLRVIEVSECRSKAVIVEVNIKYARPLDRGFMEMARGSGYTYLERGSGPFIAMRKGFDFSPMTVVTKPLSYRGQGRWPENLMWKIMRPVAKRTILMVCDATSNFEGKVIMVFAPI